MRSDVRFSVLLPVYGGDRADYLRRAFDSAVLEQTLAPDQVVIVQDGPVPAELAHCLRELEATSPVPVSLVCLEHNAGLGPALDAGLLACRFDIVARMDADDIAMAHRFATQIPFMDGADIVGAGLLEFSSDTGDIVGRRVPPIGQDEIVRYSRMHDPFNHPTVVYRRTAILAAGGYGSLALMEDYWLFVRMLANGARAVNLAEPLVYYRVGAEAYKRRGGSTLLRSELQLQRRFREEGFITRAQYFRNVAVRGGYRLIPWQVRRALYRRIVATYGKKLGRPASTPRGKLPDIGSAAGCDDVTPGPGERPAHGAGS